MHTITNEDPGIGKLTLLINVGALHWDLGSGSGSDMRIENSEPKTTVPPHDLDQDHRLHDVLLDSASGECVRSIPAA